MNIEPEGLSSGSEPTIQTLADAGQSSAQTFCEFDTVSWTNDKLALDGEKRRIHSATIKHLLRTGGELQLTFTNTAQGSSPSITEKTVDVKSAQNAIIISGPVRNDDPQLKYDFWQLRCEKNSSKELLAQPITFGDVKQALGSYITFN